MHTGEASDSSGPQAAFGASDNSEALHAVRATGLADGSASVMLDSLARVARRVLGVPASLVTLLDDAQQHMPGRDGPPALLALPRSVPLSWSICRHLRDVETPLRIDDCAEHPLTRDVPEIAQLGIRAYLGVPLADAQGHRLGGFCALDFAPRPWREQDLALLRDLADAARAALESAAQARRYDLAIEASAEVLYETDPATGLGWRQGAVEAVYGDAASTGASTIGDWLARVHPDDRARVLASWRRVLAQHGPKWECEYRLLQPDGREVRLRDRARIIYAGDGRPLRAGGAVMDVTAERRALEELRTSETRLRRVVNAMRDGVVLQDRDDVVHIWNPAAERLLGLGEGDLRGRSSRDPSWAAIRPDGMTFTAEEHPSMAAMRTGQRQTGVEMGVRRPDGSRVWIVVDAEPLRFPGESTPSQVVVTMRDVTAERERAAATQLLEAELRQAQKLEAMGRLAGGVAHDFNNLLTAIRSSAELLQRRAGTDEAARVDVREILETVDRAAGLTRQLVAFSRKQVAQPRPLRLASLVEGVVAMLRRVIGEDIALTLRSAVPDAVVVADRVQLEQVLLNLAVNARDAMPDGGALDIALLDGDAAPAPHGDRPAAPVFAAPHVLLAVRDTGIGMDEETRLRAFEPFFTTKDEGRGTGLGLSTVYGIVTQAGGASWIESAPGEGTTVWLALPRSALEPAPERPRHDAAAAAGGGTVLLVEDDDAVLRTTTRLLERLGYTVHGARGGDEALRIWDTVAQRCGAIDLIITDLVMPGMSGTQLIERVRARCPEVPILVVSGYAGEERWSTSPESRTLYLEKPYSVQDLMAALGALRR